MPSSMCPKYNRLKLTYNPSNDKQFKCPSNVEKNNIDYSTYISKAVKQPFYVLPNCYNCLKTSTTLAGV